jgi:uncharacterized protein DUF3500
MTTSTFRPRQKEAVSARDLSSQLNERTRGMRLAGEEAVAKPFVGIASDGKLAPGLFPIEKTGVSTEAIRAAAEAWLKSLPEDKKTAATFPIDSDVWRRWSNVHMFLMRHGVNLEDVDQEPRERGLRLMRETLSTAGYETARNIMKLNETIREITGRDIEFGEWPYWLSVLGEPSPDQPWGWQIDGHHLIVNCFILGDQLVLTPLFMGSEPTTAPSGKYAGVRVFEQEDRRGLALVQALDPEQQDKAVIARELPDEVFTAAYRDNFDLSYQGLRFDSLSSGQRELALALIETYVRRLRAGHDEVWLNAVKRHLDETYFAWMGGTGDDNVFYYRVHSPVVLIEFDHLKGIALENDVPTREHIHTVVRTPNGNDYGRDLLRQHYERYSHARA